MSLTINNNLMARNTARHLEDNYGQLATSVRRLSSGLRVNSAADDAAGLAIRELMRSDVSALYQGVRNANDAISMIQTADGALAVIDEKLIRMKELAEQAATGTYDSTQRLIIDSEFQQMALEIDRIAKSTDFNGIHLLDGSLAGEHDGSGLTSTGAMKIHFGTGNDSAEDYYYVEIGDCTLAGLGLRDEATTTFAAATRAGGGTTGTAGGTGITTFATTRASGYGNVPIFSDVVTPGEGKDSLLERPPNQGTFSALSVGIIPAGTTDFYFYLHDSSRNDTIQIFTRDGKHIAGTTLDRWTESPTPTVTPNDFMTEANGFSAGAIYDGSNLNGTGQNLSVDHSNQLLPLQNFSVDGMTISYTGDGGYQNASLIRHRYEEILIANAADDLILVVAGYDSFLFQASWTDMPGGTPGPGPSPPVNPDKPVNPTTPGGKTELPQGDIMSIKTQNLAQQGLERIDRAITIKDKVRANLGATQNRLENTVTNLSTQAENLQASESQISDVDVATEMTQFVRSQILTQSGTAMLAQANSLPQMLARLIEG